MKKIDVNEIRAKAAFRRIRRDRTPPAYDIDQCWKEGMPAPVRDVPQHLRGKEDEEV